jgi:predicted RNase H-like HicB family nuclease
LLHCGVFGWAMKWMPKYEVIIYWSDDDQDFIAEIPELPGCAVDGKSYQAALANVELVIRHWIDTAQAFGRPIPVPKGRLVFA